MKHIVREVLIRAYDAIEKKDMSQTERRQILEEIDGAICDVVDNPWLKILAYAIGLILACYGTMAVAATIVPSLFM